MIRLSTRMIHRSFLVTIWFAVAAEGWYPSQGVGRGSNVRVWGSASSSSSSSSNSTPFGGLSYNAFKLQQLSSGAQARHLAQFQVPSRNKDRDLNLTGDLDDLDIAALFCQLVRIRPS